MTTRIHPCTQTTPGQVSGWGWPEVTILTGRGPDDEWAQMSMAQGGWGSQTMDTKTLPTYKTNYLGGEGAVAQLRIGQAVHSEMRREGVVFTSYSVAVGLDRAALWRGYCILHCCAFFSR